MLNVWSFSDFGDNSNNNSSKEHTHTHTPHSCRSVISLCQWLQITTCSKYFNFVIILWWFHILQVSSQHAVNFSYRLIVTLQAYPLKLPPIQCYRLTSFRMFFLWSQRSKILGFDNKNDVGELVCDPRVCILSRETMTRPYKNVPNHEKLFYSESINW